MSLDLFGGRRLKMGIWGLGRGSAFVNSARALGIDIVAGCDFDDIVRNKFHEICPEAVLTDNEEDFFKLDFEAVLVSTFCPNHAQDTIKALKAGKHVLSEVTAFFTPAQGVELVEEVEKRGLVYNLAENYPFTKLNMYLARLYKQGIFGELAYAEFDYVHGGVNPCVTYLDGTPLVPGNRLHHWRGWLNYHYYCTHSLGPIMVISGLRPEKVTAFPEDVFCKGTVHGKGRKVDGIVPNLCAFAPSLIQMSNGSVVRNLMGGSVSDSHQKRFFGTKAAYDGKYLHIGGAERGPRLEIDPQWDEMGQEAEKAGHGGGDFWELYYFARQIVTGEKAPWDIYAASDVTLAGIQALRSALSEGEPMEIPDFRKKEVRDRYRNDNWMAKHIEPEKIFPEDQDTSITNDFAPACKAFVPLVTLVRSALDGMKVYDAVKKENKILVIEKVKELRSRLDEIRKSYSRVRKIADAYPSSQGGEALREKLELGEEARIMDKDALLAELDDFLIHA
ncbi:MAG: hypothetical protein J6A21_12110 [Lentisphaeria bacterium]|nr:hypothetical protein [Lentisphaeria bacterium]